MEQNNISLCGMLVFDKWKPINIDGEEYFKNIVEITRIKDTYVDYIPVVFKKSTFNGINLQQNDCIEIYNSQIINLKNPKLDYNRTRNNCAVDVKNCEILRFNQEPQNQCYLYGEIILINKREINKNGNKLVKINYVMNSNGVYIPVEDWVSKQSAELFVKHNNVDVDGRIQCYPIVITENGVYPDMKNSFKANYFEVAAIKENIVKQYNSIKNI